MQSALVSSGESDTATLQQDVEGQLFPDCPPNGCTHSFESKPAPTVFLKAPFTIELPSDSVQLFKQINNSPAERIEAHADREENCSTNSCDWLVSFKTTDEAKYASDHEALAAKDGDGWIFEIRHGTVCHFESSLADCLAARRRFHMTHADRLLNPSLFAVWSNNSSSSGLHQTWRAVRVFAVVFAAFFFMPFFLAVEGRLNQSYLPKGISRIVG